MLDIDADRKTERSRLQ